MLPYPAQATSIDRLEATNLLDEPVTRVRFVDSRRAQALQKLGISSVRDLLTHYPHRYNDLSTVVPIGTAPLGEKLTVMGRVDEVKVKKPRPRLTVVEVSIIDGTGVLIATWFNQAWIANKLTVGSQVLFHGKVSFDYGFRRMDNPVYTVLEEIDGEGVGGNATILPVHHATGSLSPAWVSRLVTEALKATQGVLDPLPPKLRSSYHLMDRGSAWRAIHFPQSMEQRSRARKRLAYEEMLELQLKLMRDRSQRCTAAQATAHEINGPCLQALKEAIPFTLTQEQQSAVSDILQDMAQALPAQRLLLGDVGSGKTIVAAHALAAVADSHTQGVMMAPTEVLATQYGEKLGPLLDAVGVSWALLTSGTSKQRRQEILANLSQGLITILFGTHAVLEDDVVLPWLSLVVIDEQHRFGVEQRKRLMDKGAGCDLLSMTATPIPRSLALTLYGDMDCSYIKQRPVAGAKITTKVLPRRKRGEAYDAIRDAVAQGHQAYIICPLISAAKEEESEEDEELLTEFSDPSLFEDVKAAEKEYQVLSRQAFPEFKLALMTGRLSSAEKRQVMEDFRSGAVDVLVSTTVVEVGVDVPNATVMMIENAERFGLTQLHQLRGRVGRGGDDATVYLIAQTNTPEGEARMEAIESCSDGFKLAQYDLSLRREGDIFGSRQHGRTPLKLINVIDDEKLIATAHADAQALLQEDPLLSKLEHALLAWDIKANFEGGEPPCA